MAGYIRQSTYTDGDVIQSSDSNNEFDALLDSFNNSTGHAHDGTTAEGPVIGLIGDAGVTIPLNKLAVDTANDRLSFYIDVASTSVEQLRIEDGVAYPVTNNDIDLGTSVFMFKDGYFAGTLESVSLQVTNIKANDGTAVGSIADATGVFTIASAVLTTADINGGTVDNTVIGATTPLAGSFTALSATGNITVGGTVDGRDVATDGTKLDTVETNADVTDATNVTAAGALMDSELTNIAAIKALNQGVATTDSPTFVTINATTVNATTFDMTNLEVTNIKAKDGTAAASIANTTGVVTVASSVLTTADINGGTVDGTIIGSSSPSTGAFTSVSATGNITVGGTVDGRDLAADGTKLDGIEALADVTDTTNVTAAGALMDSELTNLTAVKAINQGLSTSDSPSFVGVTATVTGTVSSLSNHDTDDLSEGATNQYYTTTRVNSAIDARVDTTFVNALNVDAATLEGDSKATILATAQADALALSIALG